MTVFCIDCGFPIKNIANPIPDGKYRCAACVTASLPERLMQQDNCIETLRQQLAAYDSHTEAAIKDIEAMGYKVLADVLPDDKHIVYVYDAKFDYPVPTETPNIDGKQTKILYGPTKHAAVFMALAQLTQAKEAGE